jgi:hypothetical protein
MPFCQQGYKMAGCASGMRAADFEDGRQITRNVTGTAEMMP